MMMTDALEVRVQVFGGLRVWRGSYEADVGPPRQQVVLALLLAAGGGTVGLHELVDAVWPTDPPQSAVNQIHRLVGQLRRIFEPTLPPHAAGCVVLAASAGYRLAVELVEVDLLQLRDLARRADRCANTGDGDKSTRLYVEALDHCTGQPFAGFDARTLGRPEVAALARERESLVVAAASAAVRFRRYPGQVLAAVRRVAADAPLNESVHAALIRLLAAMGRRAEALAAYDQVRRALADELGIDPGPHLVTLFQRLLADDDQTGPAATAAPEPDLSTAPSPRPAQLPRRVAGFVDRSDLAALGSPVLEPSADSLVITAVGGMAGIGKTALAVHWAHQVADRFPDGQLYLNLRGFDATSPPVDPADALARLVESLGEPAFVEDRADVDARSAHYRSLMSNRRMIVLLDNARDSAQVRPLLPGSSGCLVFVTSRNRLTGLAARDGARHVELDRLSDADARTLLTNRIGPVRAASQDAALDRIVAACHGLPLALAITAGRIATDPTRSLADVADELQEPHRQLDALTTGEPDDDLRSVLSWSVRALSPDAARLLRHMAAHPGPQMSAAALASITGRTLARTEQLARELVNGSLLTDVGRTATGGRRYVLHDLVRAFADEGLDAAGERPDAERLLVQHYQLATRNAFMRFGREPDVPLTSAETPLIKEEPAGVAESLTWYSDERTVQRAVVDVALRHNMKTAAALLVLDRRPMEQTLDTLSDAAEQCHRVLDSVDSSVPSVLVAELHRDLAMRVYDFHTSQRHLTEALARFRELDDPGGQSNVYRNLAEVTVLHQEHEAARGHAQRAVELAEQAGRLNLLAMSLLALCGAALSAARFREAIEAGQRAAALMRELGLEYELPYVFGNLGKAWLELGDAAQAMPYLDQGIELLCEYPNPTIEYLVVACRVQAAFDLGDRAAAAQTMGEFDRILTDEHRAMLLGNGVDPHEVAHEIGRVDTVRRALHS